jgi:hypothetical protein
LPYTVRGCGTRYYGERDTAKDGSYTTTEWATLIYLPLLPVRSLRVLPIGQETYSSQHYQIVRIIPLCWAQVRNVYTIWILIVLLVLFLNRSDGQRDTLKSSTSQIAVQMEPQQTQPVESDLPLSSKDAAASCGKVLKLGDVAFKKLHLVNRLSSIVDSSGFTEEEFKMASSEADLNEEAFSSYSLAYLSWDKPTELSRANLDKKIVDTFNAVDTKHLSSDQKVEFDSILVKSKSMMLKAFDLGRHDAKISPCPF